jgi:long-chain acyl-CoA synthetase
VADYAGLAGRAARLAGALRERYGLAEGERVALVMKNCPAYVEVLFGLWWAGLAAVPMNAKLHAREFRYMLEDSGARLCFVTGDLATRVGEAAEGLAGLREIVEVETAGYERLMIGEPAAMAACGGDALAWLFYTSGTTGRPKGAMLSHANLLAMTACYFADVDAVAAGDSILHAAPMSHGSGLYILPHVAQGAAQIVPESGGFDPAEVFELLAAHRGVSFFFAPTMVKRLVEHPEAGTADTSNFKTCIYGGGPMYVEDVKRAMQVFGNRFVQIYGQGESPMTITALSRAQHGESGHPRYEARLASVGRPQLLVEVRIAGADDRPLAAGETGEILARGPSVMPGYWGNPEATAATLAGGWLHTGDLGSLDAEGFLTLKDRSKDVIISGGTNIYPREIEEVLLHHNGVLECSVVGQPDPEWGEIVVAFVVARPGVAVEAAALDKLCLAEIARFKRPKAYRFLDALPKNNYGKVLKTELRRTLAAEAERGA